MYLRPTAQLTAPCQPSNVGEPKLQNKQHLCVSSAFVLSTSTQLTRCVNYWHDAAPTLADDILLRAMLPEASTTKMTSAPAFLASFLLRMSDFSTYTFRARRPEPSAA